MLRFQSRRATFDLLSIGVVLCALALPLLGQPDIADRSVRREEDKKAINAFVLSPDGRYVALIQTFMWFGEHDFSYDPTGSRISLWEVSSGRLIWKRNSPSNDVPQGIFSPDGSKFLCHGMFQRRENNAFAESRNYVRLWATLTGDSLPSLELNGVHEIEKLIFSPDGQEVIGEEGYLTAWDANTGKLLRRYPQLPYGILRAGWSRVRDKYLFTLFEARGEGNLHELTLWSLPDFKLQHTMDMEFALRPNMALSPDGMKVAFQLEYTPKTSDEVRIWDVRENKSLALDMPVGNAFKTLYSLQFAPDSQTLLGCRTFMEPMVLPLALNGQAPANNTPVKLDVNGTVFLTLWDIRNGKVTRTLEFNRRFNWKEGPSYSILLQPDGKGFVAMDATGNLELRSLEDGALIRTFE